MPDISLGVLQAHRSIWLLMPCISLGVLQAHRSMWLLMALFLPNPFSAILKLKSTQINVPLGLVGINRWRKLFQHIQCPSGLSSSMMDQRLINNVVSWFRRWTKGLVIVISCGLGSRNLTLNDSMHRPSPLLPNKFVQVPRYVLGRGLILRFGQPAWWLFDWHLAITHLVCY